MDRDIHAHSPIREGTWKVSEDEDGEFVKGFNSIDPSRGIYFVLVEVQFVDQLQQAVEMGETIPSIFEPEEIEQ
ncbi:hypothetical protein GQ42DRAFT_58966 [Ramicandelaber brevisporus]|nr:hypothetical protein GQ42DRAFT_58966 [Ramicandelaber brevisporus]